MLKVKTQEAFIKFSKMVGEKKEHVCTGRSRIVKWREGSERLGWEAGWPRAAPSLIEQTWAIALFSAPFWDFGEHHIRHGPCYNLDAGQETHV